MSDKEIESIQPKESTEGKGLEDITMDNAYKLYDDEWSLPDTPVPTQLGLLKNKPTFTPTNGIRISEPVNLPEQKEGEGFFASMAHEFREQNEILAGIDYLHDNIAMQNPLDDTAPEGWNQFKVENYSGIDEKYWPMISNAHSPKQLDVIRDDIFKRMEADEEFNNGSMAGKLIGGIGAFLTSPSSLIPLSSVLKSAKASEQILANTMRIIPGITAQSAAHNLYMESLKTNPKLEDAAVNTFRDAVIGTALAGVGFGIGHILNPQEIFANRKALNITNDGMDVKLLISDDGKDLGRNIPVPGDGVGTVGAKKFSDAENFLNSTISKENMFKLPKMEGFLSAVNPTYRGMTSRYPVIRRFTDVTSEHSLITEGNLKGIPKPMSFELDVGKWRADLRTDMYYLQGLWQESNGIDSSKKGSAALKQLVQKFDGSQQHDWEGFGDKAINTILTGEQHDNQSINAAADYAENMIGTAYTELRDAYGMPEEFMGPRTSKNYFMRSYKNDELVTRNVEYNNMAVKEYKEQDSLISEWMSPIEHHESHIANLKSERKELLARGKATTAEVKESSDVIEAELKALNRANHNLANEIHEDDYLRMLAEDNMALSGNESRELKQLLSGRNKLQNELDKIKSEVTAARNKVSKSKSASQKAKTSKTASKHSEMEKVHKKELSDLEVLSRKAEEALEDELERLQVLAYDGSLNFKFFVKDAKTVTAHFVDHNNRYKFRERYRDDAARWEEAEASRNTILNHTQEQLSDHLLLSMTGKFSESPIKRRTQMIPDTLLYQNKFMHTDLNHVLGGYINFMKKRTSFKKSLNATTSDGTIESLAEAMTKEHNIQVRAAENIKDSKKRIEEKRRLEKDFESGKDFLNKMQDTMLGRTSWSSAVQQFSKNTKLYAVLTQLMGIPLTMVVEPAAIVMQHGMWPAINEGLVPFISTMNGMAKGKNSRAFRENAANAGLSIEHILNGYTDKMFNNHATPDVPVGGVLGSGLERITHASSYLAGTISMDNALERATASVAQGKIMRYMHKFVNGKLSKKEMQELLSSGIDPDLWAKKFVKEWESVGADTNGRGGYLSHYYNWKDAEASNVMSDAIRRMTRETILKRGMFSSPFWTNDPVVGMAALFKGWGFEAFARYTMPMMQKPDGENAMGMALMLMMGSLVTPLRRLSRGEEPYEEGATGQQIFWQSLVDSGVLGVMTDFVEDGNVISGGRLLKNWQNDRYRERTVMGVLGGPVGSIADNATRVIGMMGSSEYNISDMKRLSRLAPFTGIPWLRYINKAFIEGLDLPATAAEARDQ